MGTELATALVMMFWICVLIILHFKDRAAIDFHKTKLVELETKLMILLEVVQQMEADKGKGL
jgi:hypothetical protein